MYKIIFIKFFSLTIFAILISCQGEEKINNVPFKTEPFSIKIGADGINSHFKYFIKTENDESILHYYDYMYKRLTLVNFNKKSISSHINFDDYKYPINGLSQMIETDSNYYVIRNADYMYWMDFEGNVNYFEDTRSFKGTYSEDKQYRLAEIESSNSNRIDFHILSEKSNHEKGYLGSLKLAKFYYNDKSIEILPFEVHSSEYVRENETLVYRSNPFLLSWGQKVIVHYPFTADLQIVDLLNKKSDRIKHDEFKSSLPNMNPITFKEYKDAANSMRIKSLDEQTYYYPLIFDEFRKIYYRPYMPERDLDLEKNADFSLKILVYNTDFQLMGQLDIGDIYMPFLYITKEAVYIRKKDQRESYIDMDELIFEING